MNLTSRIASLSKRGMKLWPRHREGAARRRKRVSPLAFAAVAAFCGLPLHAAVQVWQGTGADGNWSTTGNFNPGAPFAITDDLQFAGSNFAPDNFNDLSLLSVASLTFNAGADLFTLNGNALFIGAGGITNLSASFQTISLAQIGPNVTQTWDAGAIGLFITSPVRFDVSGGSVALTITGGGETLISGVIDEIGGGANVGSIIKDGAGILTLSGVNSYTGGTTLNAGTVSFANGSLGTTGTIDFAGDATLQWLTGNTQDISSRLKIEDGITATIDTNGNDVTFATTLQLGAGQTAALTKAGSGVLTLGAANTYTGGTTVNGGLVNFAAGNNLGTGNITLNGGGLRWAAGNTLDISDRLNAFGAGGGIFDTNGNDVTLASALTGTGSLTKNGAGTLSLTSVDNAYAGGTIIIDGRVSVTVEGNLGTGGIGFFGGELLVDGSTFATSKDVEVFDGSTGRLSNSNAAQSAFFSGNVFLGSGSTLAIGSAGNSRIVVLMPAGGSATAFSNVSVDFGTLQNGNGTNFNTVFGSANFNVAAGATFDIAGYDTTIGSLQGAGVVTNNVETSAAITITSGNFSGMIQDGDQTLALIKTGTSTDILTLTGVNNYSDGTTVNGGLINFAAGNNLGTTNITLDGGGLQWAAGNTTDISSRLNAIGATGGEFFTGGATFDTNGNNVTFASALTGPGSVTKTGAGTLALTNAANNYTGATRVNGGVLGVISGGQITATSSVVIGAGIGDAGTLTVDGATSQVTTTGSFFVGDAGTGTLNVLNGGKVTSGFSVIASQLGSIGTVTVDGANSKWTINSTLLVDTGGTATLSITNGGEVSDVNGYIATNNFSLSGTVTVDGANSKWTNSSTVIVGDTGPGTLNVLNGGLVTSFNGIVGNQTGSVGIVTVSGAGSKWTMTGGLTVDMGGTGTVNILNGGVISNATGILATVNNFLSGTMTVDGAGSQWINSGNIIVGDTGPGTLNISNGGLVSANGGAGTVTLGNQVGSAGTLNIGRTMGGDGPGILNAATVNGGLGTALINLNHTSTNYTFAPTITGSTAVFSLAGTTILTAVNTYTGATTIQGNGTLRVNGSLAAGSAVTVGGGGTLGGTGTVFGTVTVNQNGTIAPGNSAGTITLGSLIMNAGSFLTYELATPNVVGGGVNDLTIVNGALTLDGAVNVTDIGGFGVGTYRLINYLNTEAFTDNGLDLGFVPGGFGYRVDTATLGQVNLVVDVLGLQYWDGPNTGANNVVDGGTAFWNNVTANWTNSTGSLNGRWNSQTGVFSGTAGIVTLGDNIAFTGLQFSTDGYVINEGFSILPDFGGTVIFTLIPTGVAPIIVDAGVTATINAQVTGTGGLVKINPGTVILTAANSYTGGTGLSQGTVGFSNDSLGTTGAVTFLNSSTLRWNTGNTQDISSRIIIQDEMTATFDTNGNNVTFASSLQLGPEQSAAVTKIGTGTLTLTAPNGYTGVTTVNEGVLAIDSDDTTTFGTHGSGPVIVNGGATAPENGGHLHFLNSATAGNGPYTINGPTFGGAGNGTLEFFNTSSAGTSAFTANGGTVPDAIGGTVFFHDNATASTATVTANGGNSGGGFVGEIPFGGNFGGNIVFFGNSTAANSTLIVNSGTDGGGGGSLFFFGDSTGGTARVIVNGGVSGGNGTMNINLHNVPGVTIGSLEGGGDVILGPNNLTVGANELSTIFSGTIKDFGGSQEGAGGGSLTKIGEGTLTLSGVSTYSGPTLVNAGTLLVNGSLSVVIIQIGPVVTSSPSAVTVNNGATLGGIGTIVGPVTVANGGTLAPGASPGTITVGTLTLNATSVLAFELGQPQPPGIAGTDSDLINVNGALVLDGLLNVTNAGGFGPGTYRLINYQGGFFNFTNNTLDLAIVPGGFSYSVDTATANQVNLVVNFAGLQFWDGPNFAPNNVVDGGTFFWNNELTNWTNSTGSVNGNWGGEIAVFSGATGTVTLADNIAFTGMQFITDNYVIDAGASEGGSFTLNPTGIATILVDTGLTATINAPIVGTGGLTKINLGTLVLTAANSYTGGTTLNAGTVAFSNDSLGTTGTVDFAGNSTLRWNTGNTQDISSRIKIEDAVTATIDTNGNNVTFASSLQLGPLKTAALTKTGAGTLTLTAPNTYTGGTTVTAGILEVGNGGTTGNIVGNVVDNATLVINRSDAVTFGGVISGTGSVHQNGAGTTTFTGASTYTGGTTIAFGTLQLGNGGTTGSIVGNVLDNATLAFNRSDTVTFGGIISGTGAVQLNGTGTTIFTAANTYSGPTTVNAGRLLANNPAGSATGTGAVTVLSGATLGGTGTISGPVTINNGGNLAPGYIGTGTITVGTLTLNPGSLLSYEFGPPNLVNSPLNDLTVVNGNLTLDGTLNIAGIPGFAEGTYRVFNYSGSLTNNILDLGVVPGGYLFTVDVATANQVNLIVTGFGPLPIAWWDGPNTTPNGVVDGGTFTWDNRTTNWTNATGFPNGFWASGFGFFAGAAGTVTIIDNIAYTGLQFITDGYIIDGLRGLSLRPNGIAPIITDPGVTATIDAMITGSGGLAKEGAGTLILTNLNTYTGNTFVNGGTLLVNGSITSPQVFVNPGGVLGGHGILFGQVINSGVVSPGTSPGTLHIKGNYTQSSAGTLLIEVGGHNPGEFDVLEVGGHASLGGTLQFVRLNNFKLKRGDRLEFLTAGQGIDGEFSQVIIPFKSRTILRPGIVYDDNGVFLTLIRQSFQLDGLTPNQRAIAQLLDQVADDPRMEKIFSFLDERVLEKLPGDFDKIAPEELASIFNLAVALAQLQAGNLQRHTDGLRSGATGFSASGLAMNGTGPGYNGPISFRTGAAGPTGDAKESKEIEAAVPEEKRWGAFLTGVGEWVDVGGDGNARGYDITTGGFTLGVDYKVCPNFAIGIMAGYAGTAADLTDDGRVWVNGGKLGVYATAFTGGWYADTAVTGGYNSYDTKRSALQGTARGSTDGGELNVLVGTGYDWKLGALQIGPTATFNYTLTGIDGYTEHGSLAPLNIASRNAESVRSAFGFKASYDWKLGGMVVKPEVRAAWQHEYGDSSYDISSSFANGAGGRFLVNGPEIGRDSLLLGAGFAVQLNERAATYLYYDGELGRERYDSHSVSGGLRVAF